MAALNFSSEFFKMAWNCNFKATLKTVLYLITVKIMEFGKFLCMIKNYVERNHCSVKGKF